MMGHLQMYNPLQCVFVQTEDIQEDLVLQYPSILFRTTLFLCKDTQRNIARPF